MTFWDTPVYRFRVPVSEESPVDLKEIVVNVTGSAPPFKEPSENLKQVLDDVLTSGELTSIDRILEFGAAKLKNIPYLLKKGKTVCAVEFEELAENDMTKANLKKCRRYSSKFEELIFPNPFLNDTKTFDLALLLNVLPVMPVPAERLYVLRLLWEKLNRGKYLLWVAQKEGPYKSIREAGKNDLGDGIWMGKGRYVKTFYRYHQVEELDEIMALFGFKLIKRYPVGDDARLYEKTEHPLLSDLLTPELIRKHVRIDDTILDPVNSEPKIVKNDGKNKIVSTNPRELSVEALYQEKLRTLTTGTDNAEIYHRLVSWALGRVFRGSLRNMNVKVEVNNGVKIIDTVFTNSATKGFFDSLKTKVDCAYPMVEAKNISGDPTNTEFDQLNGRFNTQRGHFGILMCRQVRDEATVINRCKTYLPNNYVMCLDDVDICELLDYSTINDEDAISDYMDRKLQGLLF